MGKNKNTFRVLRDGSWFDFTVFTYCSYRDYGNPINHGYNVGFRVTLKALIRVDKDEKNMDAIRSL